MPSNENICNALIEVMKKKGPEEFIQMIYNIQHTKNYDLTLYEGEGETYHHRLIKSIWKLKRMNLDK